MKNTMNLLIITVLLMVGAINGSYLNQIDYVYENEKLEYISYELETNFKYGYIKYAMWHKGDTTFTDKEFIEFVEYEIDHPYLNYVVANFYRNLPQYGEKYGKLIEEF